MKKHSGLVDPLPALKEDRRRAESKPNQTISSSGAYGLCASPDPGPWEIA